MAALALSALLLAGYAHAQATFPNCATGYLANTTVCDTNATPLERATALVGMMTFDEKVNITGNTSPGVPRIGLPAYQYVFCHSWLTVYILRGPFKMVV